MAQLLQARLPRRVRLRRTHNSNNNNSSSLTPGKSLRASFSGEFISYVTPLSATRLSAVVIVFFLGHGDIEALLARCCVVRVMYGVTAFSYITRIFGYVIIALSHCSSFYFKNRVLAAGFHPPRFCLG